MTSNIQKWLGVLLTGVGHLAAILGIAMGTTLLVMPWKHAQDVALRLESVPRLWDMSTTGIFIHIGLAACCWALMVIVYKLGRLRMAEAKTARTIRLSRGSVITETLVVFPIFLVLTFGMAQLAVNNIAGILANIAAYEAARAAWVWKPEAEAGRMGTTDGNAVEKCRIAVAMVMTPVAPGEFLSDVTMDGSDFAEEARMVALGANVPLMGVLSTLVPAEANSLFQAGVTLASIAPQLAVRGNLTYNTALDDQSFWLRTIRKFTHAYEAAGCEIKDDHSVKMTYQMHAAMPVVRPIFGELKIVGGRIGYFSEFVREFGFRKQVNTPNPNGPQNIGDDPPAVDGDFNPKDYE